LTIIPWLGTLQSAEGSTSVSDCICKAGFYPPPASTVLLAGSSFGNKDGRGSEAAFIVPSGLAVSSDAKFALVTGMSVKVSALVNYIHGLAV
jgi:hypothetical protein